MGCNTSKEWTGNDTAFILLSDNSKANSETTLSRTEPIAYWSSLNNRMNEVKSTPRSLDYAGKYQKTSHLTRCLFCSW